MPAPIAVLITLDLTSFIAKYIVRSWIGQDSAARLGEDIVDLLKDQAAKTAEERTRVRESDQLAEAVTVRMREHYNSSKLPANSKQAVAAEVALTLARANLSVEAAIDHNLDADRFVRVLKAKRRDATKLLSADETALYEKLLFAAAQAVVQMSGLLGTFAATFASKLLKDTSRLTHMIEQLLSARDEASVEFEQRFKELVKTKLDRLEVFGLPKLDQTSRQQSLTVAYISLDAEDTVSNAAITARRFSNLLHPYFDESRASMFKYVSSLDWNRLQDLGVDYKDLELWLTSDMSNVSEWSNIRSHGSRIEPIGERATVHFSGHGFEFEAAGVLGMDAVRRLATAGTPRSIESIIGRNRRIVVQGQAGSGKTTLLQWLAVRAASADFKPPLTLWNQSVPFYLRLREYVDKPFPAPQDFPTQIAPALVGAMPKGWVHKVLESGLALVLIDGVDELPSDQRNSMLNSLADLVLTFPLSRYVVSSRPSALKEQLWPEWAQWVENEGFTTTTLRDMDSTLIAAFIGQWYKALEHSARDEEERRAATVHANALKSLLNGRPALRRLAKNPLLCAMICALYQESLQNLPSERLKLYDECVEMLLRRRDEGRKIALVSDYPDLTFSQRLALIQDLAYWLLSNGYSDVEVKLADERFARNLPALGIANTTGEKVRRLFVERANLLRDPVVDRIEFTHPTFQEYLAARQAIEEANFGALMLHIDDDKWREVIVLALGLARQSEREKMLETIIKSSRRRNIPRAKRKQIALLALASLETRVPLKPILRSDILKNAAIAIPPSDEDEVKLVASAGDPAVSLLSPKKRYSDDEAKFCVKTLAMIGTESAMTEMTKFASDTRAGVIQAVTDSWDSFDRDRYAITVLRPFEKLTIYGTGRLQGIEHLANLKTLVLRGVKKNNELIELSKVKSLAQLELRTSEQIDLQPLVSASSLRKLTYQGTPRLRELSDFAGFARLVQLTHLRIRAQLGSTSVGPLGALRDLQELSIGTFRGVPADLEALQSLEQLGVLTITTYKTKLDLRSLAGMRQLRQLHIQSQIVPDSIQVLSSLENLMALSVPIDVHFTDIASIGKLAHLEVLTLELGSSVDFSQLRSASNLNTLRLVTSQEVKLDTISSLHQLKNLDLTSCHFGDISPILELRNLARLRLPASQQADSLVRAGRPNLEVEVISHPLDKAAADFGGLFDLSPIGLIEATASEISEIQNALEARIT